MRPPILTEKQYRILEHVFKEARARGQSPTVREICNHFGFSSPRTAHQHLRALAKKGYLILSGRHRGIELVWTLVWELFGIPILGKVPAGKPLIPYAERLGTLTPEDFYPEEPGLFALEVQGDSMVEAGILPGDIVVVREQSTASVGDIIVALVDEEATVKRLARRNGKLYLEPANPDYPTIELNGGRILGKVIRSLRNYG
jgi:repressor LexA